MPTLGAQLPLLWAVPFAGLLLSIAIVPLISAKFWHAHYGKLALAWGSIFAAPFLLLHGREASHHLLHTVIGEYLPFVAILFGLYTVSGGIVVRGRLRGSTRFNVAILAGGTILASIIGTTGASMLLIRPLLRANAHRKRRAHIVVFFIFLVSNIGGALTPLGDPPLFLGFLQGVPFFWTLKLLPAMSVASIGLLTLFAIVDLIEHRREGRIRDDVGRGSISLGGGWNLLLLGAIVGAVLMSGSCRLGTVDWFGIEMRIENLLRDLLIVGSGLLSLWLTPWNVRRENHFSWGPMLEVAKLFAAIFVTLVPVSLILSAGENGALHSVVAGIETPTQFFWTTGLLSSFLDNAPTYLTIFFIAVGKFAAGVPLSEAVRILTGEQRLILEAISAGAVFMGANSYIGNAPNFMVKAIAEEDGVEMPSFFGYILRWAIPFLIPIFLLDTLLFRLGL